MATTTYTPRDGRPITIVRESKDASTGRDISTESRGVGTEIQDIRQTSIIPRQNERIGYSYDDDTIRYNDFINYLRSMYGTHTPQYNYFITENGKYAYANTFLHLKARYPYYPETAIWNHLIKYARIPPTVYHPLSSQLMKVPIVTDQGVVYKVYQGPRGLLEYLTPFESKLQSADYDTLTSFYSGIADKKVKKLMTKYLLERFFKNELPGSSVLKYAKVKDDKLSVFSKKRDEPFDVDVDYFGENQLVQHIRENVLTYDIAKKIIKKYIKDNPYAQWVTIQYYENEIFDKFKKYIKKFFIEKAESTNSDRNSANKGRSDKLSFD